MNDREERPRPETSPAPTPCERVRGRLAELWDGDLPPLEEARDRGHLEACASCGSEWRALEELLGAIAESRGTEVELALLGEGLEERLRGVSPAAAPRRRVRRLVAAALPLAAGIAAIVLLHALSGDRLFAEGGAPVRLPGIESWRPPVADWTRGVEQLLPSVGGREGEEG